VHERCCGAASQTQPLDDYEMLFLVYGKERIETDRERKKEKKERYEN